MRVEAGTSILLTRSVKSARISRHFGLPLLALSEASRILPLYSNPAIAYSDGHVENILLKKILNVPHRGSVPGGFVG